MLDSHEEKDIKTYLAIIDNRLQNIYVTYPPSGKFIYTSADSNRSLDPSDRPVEDDSLIDLTSVTFGAINTTLARRPKTGMPDHYIDSWNSMYYLTPKGIEQVKLLTRQKLIQYLGSFPASPFRIQSIREQDLRLPWKVSMGKQVAGGKAQQNRSWAGSSSFCSLSSTAMQQ